MATIFHSRKFIAAAAMAVAAALALTGCGSRGGGWQKMQGSAWGTVYHITWQGPAVLADTVTAVIDSIDNSLSMFRPGSLVGRFNAGDSDVVADEGLQHVITVSRRVWQAASGVFDPTVAPLVEAWGFGRRAADAAWTPPAAEVIDSIMQRVGLEKVTIDADGRLRSSTPGVMLDFSAIAKGYGCDRILRALRRNGVDNAMVEVGGEIALCGHNSQGKPWRIAIDSPTGDGPTATVLELDTLCGIATSGNYRNFRASGADTIGHTIDPRTGRPAPSALRSASVIAHDCLTADALATACMALGNADSARALVARFPSARLIIIE